MGTVMMMLAAELAEVWTACFIGVPATLLVLINASFS